MAKKKKKQSNALGVDDNVAGLLCYVLGWLTGLAFLLLEPKNKFVRFHAIQSLVVFGAVTVFFILFGWVPFIGWMLVPIVWLGSIVLWIVLMVKAYQGEKFKLPISGDIAEKNA